MKATIKLLNPNACGANSLEEYNTIKELKRYLNEALYYSGEVLLFVEGTGADPVKYSATNDVATLVSEARFYGEPLCVLPTFDYIED